MSEAPRAAGSRLAFWLAYMAGVTLTAAYCANLMSHLTVRTHAPPFRTLAAMLDVRPHVAFSVPQASGVLTFFQAGVLQRAEFRYAPRRLSPPPEAFEQVALAVVAPVLGCWAAGVALAAALLVGERLRPPAPPAAPAALPRAPASHRPRSCEEGPRQQLEASAVASGGWGGAGCGGHPRTPSGLGVALGLKGAGLAELQRHRKAYDAALPAPTRLLWAD
ncbi:Protein of unknown function [Gryllus bimaculatus]|nr:Protein of unknown function [Gryllus bimaculatus]